MIWVLKKLRKQVNKNILSEVGYRFCRQMVYETKSAWLQHPNTHTSKLQWGSSSKHLASLEFACTPRLPELQIHLSHLLLVMYFIYVMVLIKGCWFAQILMKMSADCVIVCRAPRSLPTSCYMRTQTSLLAKRTSLSLLWQETTCLHVKAWWPKGSKAWDGQKGQRGLSVSFATLKK